MIARRSLPTLCAFAAAFCVVLNLPQDAPAQRPAYPIVQEIHVDGCCRILPAPEASSEAGSRDRRRQKPIQDPVVCHIESPHASVHMEEAIVGHELRRSRVEIAEQEFVLQNIASDPVVFVVEQLVGKGWQVDSDPQLVAIEQIDDHGSRHEAKGAIAFFKVHAQPGEIARLHVGERHAKALKPISISASVTTPQAGN